MAFEPGEELDMLRDSIARYVAREYDFAARTRSVNAPQGWRPEVWSWMGEMGLHALPFAEEAGGLGGSVEAITLVMRELGRGLVVEPWLTSTVAAGGLIARLGDDAQRDTWLTPLMEGRALAALAHHERADWFAPALDTTLTSDADGILRLNGHKTGVPFGVQADVLIVSASEASDGGRTVLCLVPARTAGVTCRAYPMQDGTRGAEVVLQNVIIDPAWRLGTTGTGRAAQALGDTLDLCVAAWCAEAVGAMEALRDLTVDYLRTRKQFGAPLGRFQALQHTLSDMAMEVEQAVSAAQIAVIAVSLDEPRERARLLAAAKARTGIAARLVGQRAVQLHGGMGLTDELSVGHYFKRLTMIDLTFGNADYHLSRFSDALLAEAA